MLFKKMTPYFFLSFMLVSGSALAAKFSDRETMLRVIEKERPQVLNDDDFSKNPVGFLFKDVFIPSLVKNAGKELSSSELATEFTAIVEELLLAAQNQPPAHEIDSSWRTYLSLLTLKFFFILTDFRDSQDDFEAVNIAMMPYIGEN